MQLNHRGKSKIIEKKEEKNQYPRVNSGAGSVGREGCDGKLQRSHIAGAAPI